MLISCLAGQVFTVIFTGEMFLKLFGLGRAQYFMSPWNRFDCAIVCSSLFMLLFELVLSQYAGVIQLDPTALRALRVLRIFRLINRAKGLKQLIATLL